MIPEQQKIPTSLEAAGPGDLVAVYSTHSRNYWRAIVLAVNPEKKLLRVRSERFMNDGRALRDYWYNYEGTYTNAQGRVLKRVPWDVGTIEPLTEAIRHQLFYQDTLEVLTGFRTWSYGLLKEATLEQLIALTDLLLRGQDVDAMPGNPYDRENQPWHDLWAKLKYLGVRWTRVGSAIYIDAGATFLGEADELAVLHIDVIKARLNERRLPS